MQKLELLAPAGDLKTVKAVVCAGADAVYFAGGKFGARAYAKNLEKEELLSAIDFGHIHGRKMILAVNTLLKERELEEELYEYLLPCYEQGLDAVIVQDFGVMQFIRRNFKDLPIHTSTQMTVAGVEGAKLLARMGASRIVMARELSLEEISKIHQAVSVELEGFVHGALCYCYSGQCLFSSMLGGRSGNRGRCAQPCRLPYDLYDKDFKKQNDKNHGYPLSPKDLWTIDQIPVLAESGIYSFKIEGRMKQTEYAGGVVSVYRKYIDRYLNYGAKSYHVEEADKKKLFDFGNRSGFTEGYFKQWNGPDMITFHKPEYKKAGEGNFDFETEQKESIRGSLNIQAGMPAEFVVSFQNIKCVTKGEVPSAAKSRPLTEENLRVQLEKTGNTPFAFEKLEIQLEDGLFLPMASVNELRRNALNALEEQYLDGYRRRAEVNTQILAQDRKEKKAKRETSFSASAETKEQILALFQSPFLSRIYIDSGAFQREEIEEELSFFANKAKEAGKKMYYILPAVFRDHTSVFYQSILPKMKVDGFLVKSYDALEFLFEQNVDPKRIRTDHNLYTWSKESRHAFFALGIEKDTVPIELNRNELRRRENENSEMLIYGHLPLMTSTQCLQKNLRSCQKKMSLNYLKDRYGVFFPVKNFCSECYNVIYNSRPLQLFSSVEELKSFGISDFRFSFTTESKEQTLKILEIFEQHLPFGMEYTNGHYKRGVE